MTLECLPDSLWCPLGHGLIRVRRVDCPVCGLPLGRLVVDRFGAQQWSWADVVTADEIEDPVGSGATGRGTPRPV